MTQGKDDKDTKQNDDDDDDKLPPDIPIITDKETFEI
jgi:hypothetical protein